MYGLLCYVVYFCDQIVLVHLFSPFYVHFERDSETSND